MYGLSTAELPQAGVGLVVHPEGLLPDGLQSLEVLEGGGPQQALVEERLDG